MTKTVIKTEVYTFDELSEGAKEKARQWWREGGMDYDWYESVYDDAKAIAALMGINISKIYFSGFASQGDGACFEGDFEYKAGCYKKVKEYAPLDERLHAIARDWQKLQKENNYRLKGSTRHSGHYQHSGCTSITAYIEDKNGNMLYEFDTDNSMVRDNPEAGAEATRILRRLMDWIYKQLQEQNDYITDDAQVDEVLLINNYTFTADGKRFG